ncbi:hypothetical protein Tco_1544571, partial [Tanacetum coccineum]
VFEQLMARSGTEWHGVARSGTEWHGVAQSGTEWHGVARSGTDLKVAKLLSFKLYIFM